MKVLFNASMYSSSPTGVGIYTKEIWNRLCFSSAEVICYTYNKSDLKSREKLITIKLPAFIEVLLKKSLSLHRVIWNIFYLPFLSKKYDLVYSFSSHGSPFIKNQIITIHDLICFRFPHQHRFQYFYFKYLMPYIIKSCKIVVVISEFTKSEVLKYYKIQADKIVVIPNGGDHLQLQNTYNENDEKKLENILQGERFFLTVGASYPHKNIERLMQAMQLKRGKYKLIIVGPANEYYNELQHLKMQKKMVNIIFLQYVSASLLDLLYERCIANVYVSLYEGFGFPPFEAALHNKITILSNTSALNEIYRDAAYFVNPYNVDEISAALNKVASEAFDPCYIKNNFASLFEKFNWNRTAETVSQLILQNMHHPSSLLH